MQIGTIEGVTRVLGEAQGYLALPVRDELVVDHATGREVNTMVSVWLPSAEERASIAAGAPILLSLFGTAHPPVLLSVGSVPH